MTNVVEKFGQNAGKVWNTLNKYGPLTETTIKKNTNLTDSDFYAAVGWLARENKICKTGARYKLSETNLTNKIGADAGKIWDLLANKGEVDISSISRVTQIKERDAYSALGWLAREDKIWLMTDITRNNTMKLRLK